MYLCNIYQYDLLSISLVKMHSLTQESGGHNVPKTGEGGGGLHYPPPLLAIAMSLSNANSFTYVHILVSKQLACVYLLYQLTIKILVLMNNFLTIYLLNNTAKLTVCVVFVSMFIEVEKLIWLDSFCLHFSVSTVFCFGIFLIYCENEKI